MSKIKMLFLSFLCLLGVLFVINSTPSYAQENKANVWFFYSDTCPHCHDEIAFLRKATDENPNIKVNYFEVTKNKQSSKFLSWLDEELDLKVTGVPFTLIGDKTFRGFLDEESSGPGMLRAIECVEQGSCPDIVANLVAGQEIQNIPTTNQDQIEDDNSENSNTFLFLALIIFGGIILLVILAGFLNREK
jgi:hypothetical protein